MTILKRGTLDDTLASMFLLPEYRKNYVFYAHLVGQCSIKIAHNLPAPAGVAFMHNHYHLYINPTLFDAEPHLTRLAIIKHEMLHILYGHLNRLEDRDFLPFNYASDCALNQHIEYEHILPNWIIPSTLSKILPNNPKIPLNETAEHYYDIIMENKPPECPECGGSGADADDDCCKKCKGSGSPNEEVNQVDTHQTWKKSVGDKDLQKDITKKMIESALQNTISSRGTIPCECSDWLELHSRKSEVNWKKLLRGIVGNKKLGKRPTIKRRDRRFPNREELRGKTKERVFNLLVVADVSGSMSQEALISTLLEVKHICFATNTDVDLIQIDTDPYPPEKITKTTKVFNRKGNGGTSLYFALDAAKTHNLNYQAIVVLTDGELSVLDVNKFKNTNLKVIWLIENSGTIMPEMNSDKMTAIKLSPLEL